MATSANIRLGNIENLESITISHDGDPKSVLKLLATFFSIPTENQTFRAFEDIYLSEYSNVPHNRVSIHRGSVCDAAWEYAITPAGRLTVSPLEIWNESEVDFTPCDPLHYLDVVLDEFKSKVEKSIARSIELLSNLNIRASW